MSAPDKILSAFQWLVIPHGSRIDNGVETLLATVRVIPQLYARHFEPRKDPRLSTLFDPAIPNSAVYLRNWPRFVADLGRKHVLNISLAGRGAARGSANLFAVPCKVRFLEEKPENRSEGEQWQLTQELWKEFFPSTLVVKTLLDPDNPASTDLPASLNLKALAPMPHREGATLLRNEIGRAHVHGILDQRPPRDLAEATKWLGRSPTDARGMNTRQGVAVSVITPEQKTAIQALAEKLSRFDDVLGRFQDISSNLSRAGKRDFNRMLAVGFPPGVLPEPNKIADMIGRWNDSKGIAGTRLPNGSTEALREFFLHRLFVGAPDLAMSPTEIASLQVQTTREKEEEQKIEQEKREFHRDLSKIASHPWLLDRLGLTFDIEIPIPANWPAEGGLYVESLVVDGVRVEPHIEMRALTSRAIGWQPLPDSDSQISQGCILLSEIKNGSSQNYSAFALEQLDIDYATEKLISASQTLASQLEAGVVADRRVATLGSLRTTGLSLLMRDPDRIANRAKERLTKRRNEARLNSCTEMYADDLMVGFRPDIAVLSSNDPGGTCQARWKSLTRRKLYSLRIGHHSFEDRFKDAPTDECFLMPHGRLVDDTADRGNDDPRKIDFEELFCWRGWSLAVPHVETLDKPIDAPYYMPKLKYESGGGLPPQRFGFGYRVGARAVYVDGRSISLDDARKFYDEPAAFFALGTPEIGTGILPLNPDSDRYFTPFLRYESVDPAVVQDPAFRPAKDKAAPRHEHMQVTSDGKGRVRIPECVRVLTAPRLDLDNAIRAGCFETAGARRSPPRNGVVPDPWAQRLIIGIYRRGDGQLLRMEYFDYYEDPAKDWPKARALTIRLRAEIAEVLPPLGYEVLWDGDTLLVRAAPGVALEIRHWHEMDERRLAASGVVEAMSRWLTSMPGAAEIYSGDQRLEKLQIENAKEKLGIEQVCTDFCDMRDRLIKVLSQWHEKYPTDLRAYFASGRIARDTALTSFSMINPAGTIHLAHAVPIPARAPLFSQADARENKRVARLPMVASEVARRFELRREERGGTVGTFVGDLEIHRASTERVECFAHWQEFVDEVGSKTWRTKTLKDQVFRIDNVREILSPTSMFVAAKARDGSIVAKPSAKFDIPPDNDLLMLNRDRTSIGREQNDDLGFEPHFDFGDAKARHVFFDLQATSRFAEEFPDDKVHSRDWPAQESRWLKATMPPAKPEVAYIVPLFEIEPEIADNKSRHRRRGGWFRIWLERPWFSSGEGELLALVCLPSNLFRARGGAKSFLSDKLQRAWGSLIEAAPQVAQAPRFKASEQLARLYTGWGLDPIWDPGDAKLFFIPPGAFANRHLPDVHVSVVPSQFHDLPDVDRAQLEVALALYKPEFDEGESRWYVDVRIEPDDKAYFPFVRLGLARYQPNAVKGCELSEIVASEFVQLAPDRSATIEVGPRMRGCDRREVRIGILGPASTGLAYPEVPVFPNQMVVRVDKARRTASRGVDVWEPLKPSDKAHVEEVELEYDPASRRWSVEAHYDLPAGGEYSAYLEEREGILVDSSPTAPAIQPPKPARRVIYADRIKLRIVN